LSKRKPRRKSGGSGGAAGFDSLYRLMDRFSWPITISILVVVGIAGLYVRLLPAIHYGLELDANDPWIAYWIAKYFHEHGLFNLEGLKHVSNFWYPEGRNFLTTAKIGISWFAAATYPIGKAFGLTLKEWVALMPPSAAALGLIVVFIFVYRLTKSKLGALTAATLYSLAPGAIVRTTVGFVEKIGIAFPLIVLFLWLSLEAFRARSPRGRVILSLVAGAFGASIGLVWGGYALAFLIVLVAAFIHPILEKPRLDYLEQVYLPLYVGAALVFSILPGHGVRFLASTYGLLVASPLVVYLLAFAVARLAGYYDWRLHAWLTTSLLIIAGTLVSSGVANPGERALAAIGIRHLSPLVESVQEHAPAPMRAIMREYGVALILSISGIIAEAVMGRRGGGGYGRALRISIYLVALFLVYANKNMSYFTEMAASMNTLAAGLFVGSLASLDEVLGSGRASRRKHARESFDELKAAALAIVVLVVAVGALYGLQQAYVTNEAKAASIKTSMLGPMRIRTANGKAELIAPLNGAWINALQFINQSTPPNALIVSWWDYGYWITVNTNRATVADGATLNETQIRILARLLTGNEDGASALLREYFHAKPGKTYIVFYDVFLGFYNNGTIRLLPYPSISNITADGTEKAVVHGLGDLPKSFQMLRIGYRVDPFVPSPFLTNYSTRVYQSGIVYHHFPGFTGNPQESVNLVYNTLLYKLTVAGLYELNRGFDNFILDEGCKSVLSKMHVNMVIPSVASSEFTLSSLRPVELHRFSLVNMSIGCPEQLASISGSSGRFVAVIVFIFQWNG
jgi:dolichyl-diphosphooligosaccharide--protein glycosyltransferase